MVLKVLRFNYVTMSQLKLWDALTECRTVHIRKYSKQWYSHRDRSIKPQGDYFEGNDIDQKLKCNYYREMKSAWHCLTSHTLSLLVQNSYNMIQDAHFIVKLLLQVALLTFHIALLQYPIIYSPFLCCNLTHLTGSFISCL